MPFNQKAFFSSRKTNIYLGLTFLFIFFSRIVSVYSPSSRFPPFHKILMKEYASLDTSLVLMGLRRVGGELSFIQYLQYLSAPQKEINEKGNTKPYPRLLVLSKRTGSLNPYYHYSYLFGAGVLAFTMNRHSEAIDLLAEGIRWDPSFWRYRLYAGAIAFREKKETHKVIELLESAITYPDCPSMIKNILAGIYKKQGRYLRAAEIYIQLLNSRDKNYIIKATQNLHDLEKNHGIILQ